MKKKYRLLFLSVPLVLTASVVLPVVLNTSNNTIDNSSNAIQSSNNNVVSQDLPLNNIDNQQYVDLYNSTNYAISSTYWKANERFDAAAFSNLWVDGMIPYQIKTTQLQLFAQNNTSSLLQNPPSNAKYTIDANTLIANNKTGELQFDISLDFYLFNGTVINEPFPIKKRIVLFNFNQVVASDVTLNSTNPINNFYPSAFSDRLIQLEDNPAALFNFMNNYFNIGSFPTTTKISFKNIANNATGQLNVNMNVDRYYTKDSYFTYIENPYSYSLNLNFTNQGLTTFKGYTIDISNNPILSAYSMEQFLDELVKPGNNINNPVKNQLVGEIYKLLDKQNVAITNNPSDLISFDQNKNNYEIQSNLGILTLSTTLKDLIVTNEEILKEKQFNKNTLERIYVIGFDAIIDTIVQEDPNAPIVTLDELKKSLNVNGSYYAPAHAEMRKFIQVVTPQNTAPNLSLRFLSCVQPDPNVLKAEATFSFSNAYLNGQLSTITKTFSFNILPSIYNTELSQAVTIDSINGNFFPSDIYNDSNFDTIYKDLLRLNAFSNLPLDGITNDNIRFKWVSYQNATGEITIEVSLNKYLENSNTVNSTTFKNFGNINIQGYNSTFATTATINPNYPKNVHPNKIQTYINDYMTNENKTLTEAMKLFFKFSNTPTLPQPFVVKSYSITNINLDLGTATINVVCDNVFVGVDSRLANNIAFSSEFLLLESVEPTRIKSPILLTGFNNILASEYVKDFNNSPSTDPRIVALKNTILNQAYIINQPDVVDITNITILNPESVDDIKKEFNITVTLSSYYDENGDLQNKSITFPNASYPEPILVKGDFRNVRDTKFIENSYLVDDKRNDLASTFLADDIKNYIIANWERLGMISGDIPKIFNMTSDLAIDVASITYDDPKGILSVNVSLNSYYLNQVLYNNATPYTPFTKITLTGFFSNVPTVFPDTVPATVNQGLPSNIWNKTAPEIAKSWSDYIVNDVLGGSIDRMIITNPDDLVQSVNDLSGEINFQYTTNGYWKPDANNPDGPAIFDETPQTKTLRLTGLTTQAATEFTRTTITPNNANAFVASDWKTLNFDDLNEQKQFLMNQNLLNASVNGFDYLFKTSPTDIVVNNVAGTITLNVFVNQYYDDTSALLSSYDLANNTASYVRDATHSLPQNQTPAVPNILQATIVISGFRSITSTSFINDTTIAYTGAGNLTSRNAAQINEALSNSNNENNNSFTGFIEDFLWDNVVIGTKIGQNNENTIRDNLSIVSSNPNNINGTISIKISLTHYWNTAGQWVNGSPVLSKDITLTGFLKMTPTTFNPNNTLAATGQITNSTASDVATALANPMNSTIKQTIISLLFTNDIQGTKEPYLSASDINNVSFNITDINDETGEITLSYSMNRYIDSIGNVVDGNLVRPTSVVISGFKTVTITQVIPNINLNQYFKDENGTKFDVSNITASDYLSSAAFNAEIPNLLTINRTLYFGDIPAAFNSKEDFLNIDSSAVNADTTTIRITFRMKDVFIKNANGTIVVGTATFTTDLSGFKQPVYGPTTLQTGFSRDLVDIPEVNFRTYIYGAPINGLRQNFINQLNNNSPTATDNLRKFVFNQWVNLNSNIGDGTANLLTYQDIRFEVTPQSIGSSLTIEIWLAKYYNNVGNGTFVDNSHETTIIQKQQATANNLFRKVDIRGFVEPSSTKGPTTVTRVNRFDISDFTDPDTNAPNDSLVSLLPSAAINPQHDRALRLWILEKIYGGNKEGFETDFDNVEITSSNPDDRNGELRISVQLKKYWAQPIGNPPSSPIAYNGLTHTFTIKFKEQLLPTTINTPNNLTLNVPNNDPKYNQIINDIRSKTPQLFYSEYSASTSKWNDFLDYVKDWLVLNKATAFSNLPDELQQDDDALKNAISMIYIRNSNVDASIYLNVSLSKYIDTDGQIIDNGNYRVSVQFNGFNRNNQPTYPLDARVDISQNPSIVNGVEHFYVPELAALDASKATFDQQMPFPLFLSLITPIIQKYCITGRTDGLLESNNINLTGYQQVQFVSTFGSLIIRFNFNQIYNSEGLPISGINNPVTLTLFGFVRKPPTLQSTESIIPFVLGGIGAAVFIIFIIIAFIIYYKKRKDVEYQQ